MTKCLSLCAAFARTNVFCQRLRALVEDSELRKNLGSAALAKSQKVSSVEGCAQRMASAILTAAGAT